jgi:hypothetical protein
LVTGRSFFPHLLAGPFGRGLERALDFAAVASLLGALSSLLRGGKYHYEESPEPAAQAVAETEFLLVD